MSVEGGTIFFENHTVRARTNLLLHSGTAPMFFGGAK